jgi:hypothetical protein
MTADDLLDTVRSEHNTALSRLGSSKTLYADTGGQMDETSVLTAAATNTTHAARVFEDWAAAESDLADVFATAAETADGHADEVAGRLDDFEAEAEPAAVSALADCEGDLERAGGILGWLLVQDQKATQLTGFFTGQADPQTASVFRGFGSDYDDLLDRVGETLEERCSDDADWDRAAAAAAQVLESAYEDYVETLESMGVNPKPVC